MVVWYTQNVRQDGNSFTWHQPCNKQAVLYWGTPSSMDMQTRYERVLMVMQTRYERLLMGMQTRYERLLSLIQNHMPQESFESALTRAENSATWKRLTIIYFIHNSYFPDTVSSWNKAGQGWKIPLTLMGFELKGWKIPHDWWDSNSKVEKSHMTDGIRTQGLPIGSPTR